MSRKKTRFLNSSKFHKWATLGWIAVSAPILYFFGFTEGNFDGFKFFTLFLSLYACVMGHWSSCEGALAKEEIQK